jgi:lipid-A-disaccharide synthase
LGIPDDARVVGVLPGSRHNEIAALSPVLLSAVARLAARDPGLWFVVTPSDVFAAAAIERAATCAASDVALTFVGDSHAAMRSADLLLVASGTACLEAALIGTPMIIVYKVSAITNLVARSAVRVGLIAKYVVGLPNLVLAQSVVPEILQGRATPENIADAAWKLLHSPDEIRQMQAAFRAVRERLAGQDAIAAVAAMVLSECGGRGAVLKTPRRWLSSQTRWRVVERDR